MIVFVTKSFDAIAWEWVYVGQMMRIENISYYLF